MQKSTEREPKDTACEGLTGADLLVRNLAASGVEMIFMEDHPETESIADALERQDVMNLIVPVSEISCVPMADAYARFTGKPVAAITAGGGHCLNQVMGLTTAWGDKSPVISIGIQKCPYPSFSPIFDRERTNLEEVFATISVYHDTIGSWEQIPETIRRGVRESLSTKGGTVHLEIPLEVLQESRQDVSIATLSDAKFHAQELSPPMGDPVKIREAVDLLLRAERPMIFVGGGVIKAGAVPEINELAEKIGIPILSSMGALHAV